MSPLECFGVSRSHQAIWQWVHRLADSVSDPPTAAPSRVAVDETAVQVGTEWYWLYAAIDLDSKLLLGVHLSQRRGTPPPLRSFTSSMSITTSQTPISSLTASAISPH